MTTTSLTYDPYDPAVQLDPYPTYQALRAQGPVVFFEHLNLWVVTHMDEVMTAATSPSLTATRGIAQIDPFPDDPDATGPGAGSITASDPPRHTQMRRLIQKVFSARTFRNWQPQIDRIASELVDELLSESEADVAEGLAEPLPAVVMLAILGLPQSDAPQLRRWSADMLAVLPGFEQLGMEGLITAFAAMQELADYVDTFIAGKGSAGLEPDGVIPMLAAMRDDEGNGLTPKELNANVLALILGGLETTTNLIGNGSVALLQHPEQFAEIRRDPELLKRAIEEMLRFDPPIQATHRTALEEVQIGETTIPKEGRVQLCWGAANRDEAVFRDGEQFDIHRDDPKPHIGFGTGIHYCVGAALGRAGAKAAFSTLIERTNEVVPTAEPVVKTSFFPTLRGHAYIPIRWR